MAYHFPSRGRSRRNTRVSRNAGWKAVILIGLVISLDACRHGNLAPEEKATIPVVPPGTTGSNIGTAEPEEPVRIVYKGSAGNVVFTHDVHASDGGYGQDCLSCHHNIEEDDVYDCRQCHGDDGDEDLPDMTDSLHTQCIQCHEDEGAGPVACAECHRSR